MIGVILDGLDALGSAVSNNTWVIFTSDHGAFVRILRALPTVVQLLASCLCNVGFHLGEHRLFTGKSFPYNTDVGIPLYIRGPELRANVSISHPTTLIDLTATIVELAGAIG